MSELKATTAQEIVQNEKDCDYMDELFGGVKMPPTQVYLKSEADKVIAHNKYKRCLAMARLCGKTVDHLNSEGYIYEKENHTKELTDCIRGTEFYDKWYHRWLALTEEPTWTKFLQLIHNEVSK